MLTFATSCPTSASSRIGSFFLPTCTAFAFLLTSEMPKETTRHEEKQVTKVLRQKKTTRHLKTAKKVVRLEVIKPKLTRKDKKPKKQKPKFPATADFLREEKIAKVSDIEAHQKTRNRQNLALAADESCRAKQIAKLRLCLDAMSTKTTSVMPRLFAAPTSIFCLDDDIASAT